MNSNLLDILNACGLKSNVKSIQEGVNNLFQDCPPLRSVIDNLLQSINALQKDQLPIEQYFCSPDEVALVVVDFQHDFVCGTLRTDQGPAKQNGVDIVDAIHSLLKLNVGKVFVSYDWHPSNHISFFDNRGQLKLSPKSKIQDPSQASIGDVLTIVDSQGIERDQKLWPTHCVAETQGSTLYSQLKLPEDHVSIYKGTISDVESYSVFGDPLGREDTGLLEALRADEIKTVIFCGIAFDVCVAASALDALRRGFRVVVVEDACVAICPKGLEMERRAMLEAGVHITRVSEIARIITGQFVPLQHIIGMVKQKISVRIDGEP